MTCKDKAAGRSEDQYTKEQLEFLEIFEIAARYDCLFLLDFHCFDLFDHDQTSLLSDGERAQLAAAARYDIYAEAMQKGFLPKSSPFGGVHEHQHFC